MKKLLCILIFASCTLSLHAQDSCITNLKNAAKAQDEGDFDISIGILLPTIKNCPLDKDDRIQAYKLLMLCYLNIDKLEDADAVAAAIMRIDPNFSPDKFKDDQRLFPIFDKYKPRPVFGIGISGGINRTKIKTVRQFSVIYPNGKAPELYKEKGGFQLGAFAEHYIWKGLWAEAGIYYRSIGYEHTLLNIDSADIQYSEKLTYFDIPVSVKYYFDFNRFRPYIQAGASFSFLANALSTTERKDQKDLVNRTSLRNAFNIGWFGAAGIGYSVKSFMLFANMRYVYFPGNVNKEGTRYQDEINLFKYYYLDNDFRLNNLQFNIGASIMLSYKNMEVK
jgi:hypothetical protein